MSKTADIEAAPDAPRLRPTDVVGALLALVAEGALVAAFVTGYLPLLLVVLGHLLVTLALLGRYASHVRRDRDSTGSLLLAFMVLVAGPFGAAGGLVIGWLARPEPSTRERLSDWYQRISLSTDLSATTRHSDRILTGRIADMQAPPPQSFVGVLEHGSVREKQVVLGLIARRFHPAYLPVLAQALVSDEPVIRVQAAAVAAKIRVGLAARAEASLAAAGVPEAAVADAIGHLADAERYAASGLMEDADTRRTLTEVRRLRGVVAELIEQRPLPATMGGRDAAIELVEDRMLAEGRFADFRRFRRKQFRLTGRALRYRALRRPSLRKDTLLRSAAQRGAAE